MMPTNVLIIDDSKVITKLTARILLSNKISNYFFHEKNIYIAYSAMQALEILANHPCISLIISDVMMPEINGEELVEILIDTDKIKSLEIIFITTLINKNNISKHIKNNIKGIIYKPFSVISFSDSFNKLQIQYNEKIAFQQKIKQTHIKQIKYIKSWLNDYCHEERIDVSMKILDPLLNDEFSHFHIIDDNELFMIFRYIVENYLKNSNHELPINDSLIDKIYNTWQQPEKYKALGATSDFENIILNAKTSLNKISTKDDVRYAIIIPLNHLLIRLKNTAKVKQKFPYNDFIPYLNDLLKIFTDIDPKYQDTEILLILNHIKELEEFLSELKFLLNKTALIKKFIFLKESPELLTAIGSHINICTKHIEQHIITLYVFKANELAWIKAKKSPKIISYLEKNLKFKLINTHNFLYEQGIINRTDIKKFQKYDREKIFLATRDLDILEVFKKKLILSMPTLEIAIFNTASILKNNFEKDNYTKFIIDLDFHNSVFNNGFQLIKSLRRKYPDIEKIIQNGSMYLLATSAQLEKLSTDPLNYNVILKSSIDCESLFTKFYLEN